jgi:hypothetical protein
MLHPIFQRALAPFAPKGVRMERTGVFVNAEELEGIRTAHQCSGMFLTGGIPMSDPAWEVEQLRKKYQMPEGTGLDTGNGEFVRP